MAQQVTTVLSALARLDLEPSDRAVIEVFERHARWEARLCLICGGPGGPECDRCVIAHDDEMTRREDV